MCSSLLHHAITIRHTYWSVAMVMLTWLQVWRPGVRCQRRFLASDTEAGPEEMSEDKVFDSATGPGERCKANQLYTCSSDKHLVVLLPSCGPEARKNSLDFEFSPKRLMLEVFSIQEICCLKANFMRKHRQNYKFGTIYRLYLSKWVMDKLQLIKITVNTN